MLDDFINEEWESRLNYRTDGLRPWEVAEYFTEWAISYNPNLNPNKAQLEMESNRIGDQIHVESLWSVQPDLKNKFL